MKKYSEHEINKINEENEMNQLLQWIPTLINTELQKLDITQLRILHYILGYECNEADNELLHETFEERDYSESETEEIIQILKADGYMIIRKPY